MDRTVKRRAALYCAMVILYWFSNYTFLPYLSAYANTLTTNAALVGVMLGAYGWAQVIFRVPIGIIADRYDNRRVFVRVGCFAILIATVGFWFASDIYWLIICRAVCGVAGSAYVTLSVLFSSYFDAKDSPRAMSIMNSCFFTGCLLASLMSMPVVGAFGVRASFLLGAAASVIPIVNSLTLKEKPSGLEPKTIRELTLVGRTKWVLVLSIMGGLVQIMVFSADLGFTPLLALALGAPPSSLAMIQLLSTAGGTIFPFLMGKLFINRFGMRNSLILLIFIEAVITAAQPLIPPLALLYCAGAVSGIARGTAQSLMMSLVVMPFHYTRQSAAMGFFQAIYSVGIVAGPTIAGILAALAGLNAAFYVLGALGLIAPILGLFALPDERRALPADPLGEL